MNIQALARTVFPLKRSSASPKTLYLHIGCHKTGTTSLQDTLSSNQKFLSKHGFSYYAYPGSKQIHTYLSRSKKNGLLPDGMKFQWLGKLTYDLAIQPGSVIASSENLSFVFDAQELRRLKRHLDRVFTEIKIICYLRRQDSHAISHHQEGSKPIRRPEGDLYGFGSRALPQWQPHHDLYLDYDKRLGKWADIFGKDNLMLRIYERDSLKEGDVIKDFFHLLDIDECPHSPARLNESTGIERNKVGHLINKVIENDDLKALILQHCDNTGKLLPTRQEAIEFYSHYRVSNELLNQKYGLSPIASIFSEDDLSKLDTIDDQDWTEDSANRAIEHVLETLNTIAGGIDVNDIRDSAISLEKHNLPLSTTLMELAHVLRPNGQFIQEKLEEYRLKGRK